MSDDKLVLQDGVQYNLTFLDDEQATRPFICKGFTGAGQVVDVYEMHYVRENNRIRRYALKIPRDPSREPLVFDEYQTLAVLETEQERRNPTGKHNTPTNNYYVQVQISDTLSVKGILMDFLAFPYLADFYHDQMVLAGDDLQKRLQVERMAWVAASQYLQVIEIQLAQKRITVDRKRDTFRWDEANNRLIVTDWNVMAEMKDSTERDLLHGFSQIWFTLFTQFNPSAIPTFWDDGRWGLLTVEGRWVLLQLLRRNVQTVYQAKKLIDAYLDKLNRAIADGGASLVREFESYLDAWQARPQPLTRKVVDSQFKPLAYVADILRRLPTPQQAQAQEIYFQISHAIEVRGDLSDSQLPAQRNLEKVKLYRQEYLQLNDHAFIAVREAILTIMSKYEPLKNKLLALEEAFQVVPADFHKRRLYVQDMRGRIADIAQSLAQEGAGAQADVYMNRLKQECVVIETAYEADNAMLTGDFVGALDRYQRLMEMHKDHPLEIYTHLSIEAVTGAIQLLRAVTGADEAHEASPIFAKDHFLTYADISDAGNLAALREWRNKWRAAQLSAQLSVHEIRLLGDYIDFADLLLLAHATDFINAPASRRLVDDLARLRSSFPDPRVLAGITKSRFCISLKQQATDAYEAYRANANADDSALRDQAQALNQLLLMLI